MPITKHSFIVKDVKDLAATLRRAFKIAKEGRPGPVLVDITKDATANECDYIKETPKPIERVTDTITEEDVENAVAMIKAAKKPYVFVGGGVIASEASDELRKFVKKIDAPVCDTLMGKGAFDGSDPHYTGMLGMHGTKTSNFGVSECDLLITIGASTDKKLGIEGEHSEGVLSAVQFLRDVGKNQNPDLTGQEVAVIGGGNVSMDAVRTAKRLGAKKVSIVYRRRVADMTALPAEIEGAVAEGIEVQTLMAPSRIETDENGHVKGIYVTPQMISKIKDGRASVRPTGAPDVFIPCQTLIVAIGQDIEYQHFEEAGVPVQRGKILTEKYGGFDNIPGVFAGGDCASGPASVIKAIAAAKVVAANIDEYLGYHHIISCDVEIPEARLDDRPPCGRVNMTEREACERVCDFNGVENCMSEAEAKQEASRCLRCDHFGYGIFKGGRETLW